MQIPNLLIPDIQGLVIDGGTILAVILTLIQVSKIQVNPWSWIARQLGRAINREVIDKVDGLGKDLQALRSECDEREATSCRTRIMRFGDEILHGVRHSKEHFDQILLDITAYEAYCDEHPKFKNNIATATIDRIETVYNKCMEEHEFLQAEKRRDSENEENRLGKEADE